MTQKEKLEILEEMLELDEGALNESMALSDIEEYDSMAKLSLIVLMDDEFQVKLTSEDIKGFKTVGDILARMENA